MSMKNEGKNAKHGFKIMTAVITVCAVLCTAAAYCCLGMPSMSVVLVWRRFGRLTLI